MGTVRMQYTVIEEFFKLFKFESNQIIILNFKSNLRSHLSPHLARLQSYLDEHWPSPHNGQLAQDGRSRSHANVTNLSMFIVYLFIFPFTVQRGRVEALPLQIDLN